MMVLEGSSASGHAVHSFVNATGPVWQSSFLSSAAVWLAVRGIAGCCCLCFQPFVASRVARKLSTMWAVPCVVFHLSAISTAGSNFQFYLFTSETASRVLGSHVSPGSNKLQSCKWR
eukprot:TRINITY_DN6292_c0_g1_i1.p1 TRINITY_DN6292_c0_g1~~TRINITY_DN6292_c0_g1_i1.p1  ORF type:complete len:117 (-),score=0.21 TRINITY_DN6292_c0_g1_i1:127-477(-)